MAAGQRDDEAGDLEPESGQRHDADDDAGRRGRGADTENAGGAALERRRQPARRRAPSRGARKLKPTARIVAQNTARNADIPATMKTAIATSDVKW